MEKSLQHGGHKVDRRDMTAFYLLQQIMRLFMAAGASHHQLGAKHQGQEEFPDRHIKTERRFL
ncbi:hypothetical protein Xkoz_03773 [Xenorhabdus kozodoii]|uniref:Uncharacterized protein n=1 Tax=Xenorhabdus kozodoii TaxID=351676 RepID=A0A2D0KXT8_9GAMM|nr:hypothetical protein Xkoz_03773 [Xenorhabdus kozodoii]